MAKSWCKVSAALDSHPRIRRAGNLGRQVFEFALRRNAEIDKNGVIPAEHLDPEYLADVLMLTPADAVTGVSSCVRTRLLALDGDQYVICGWDDEWGKHPMTEAERKRVQRAKQRNDAMSRKCPDTIVTESDSPECHGSEEIRSEEIRSEEIRSERESSHTRAIPPVPEQQMARAQATIPGDGGELLRGHERPHAKASGGGGHVRQGATAQGAVLGAGNVADPHIGPTAHRTESPSSPDFSDRDVNPANVPYDADDPRSRGRLAEATYRRVSDALIAMAAELGLPEPLPFPPIGPSSSAGSFRDLQDRVREEGANAPAVCDRVVANLIAQARAERSVEWLAEKSFGAGAWRTARAWMPGQSPRGRAGPWSSAERANGKNGRPPDRDPRVGRIAPKQASEYPDGEIEI